MQSVCVCMYACAVSASCVVRRLSCGGRCRRNTSRVVDVDCCPVGGSCARHHDRARDVSQACCRTRSNARANVAIEVRLARALDHATTTVTEEVTVVCARWCCGGCPAARASLGRVAPRGVGARPEPVALACCHAEADACSAPQRAHRADARLGGGRWWLCGWWSGVDADRWSGDDGDGWQSKHWPCRQKGTPTASTAMPDWQPCVKARQRRSPNQLPSYAPSGIVSAVQLPSHWTGS